MTQHYLIRPIEADEWQDYKAVRLRALKDSPEAFGSTYEGSLKNSDQEWQDRLANVQPHADLPLTAVMQESFVSLAWGKIESGSTTAFLYQMWVAPEARGHGIGRNLLTEVIHWARKNDARTMELHVTTGDRPARRLYDSAGFEPYGEPEPMRPGSDLMEQAMRLIL